MASERQFILVKTLGALLTAQQTVLDAFFQRRLADQMSALLEIHIECALQKESELSKRDYLKICKETQTLLEEIVYLQKGDLLALSVAQERILHFTRLLLREFKNQTPSIELKPAAIVKKEKTLPINQSGNKDRILEFVRRAPARRAKEIIDEFSVLSPRTVKRSLRQLSRDGFIIKRLENRAVYYSAVRS